MTNEQILDRYARGRDAEAFRLLVERYQGLVYSAASRLLGRREDVEDVTQQTFLKLEQGAGSIRQNVGAWLYATAVNGATDLIRRDATRRRHEREVGVARESEREWSEVSGVIDEEIAALPAEERALIVAHFMEGESHRAIAERMGMNQSTISRRMEGAVAALRKGLMKRGYGEIGVGAVVAGLPRMAVPQAVTAELVKVGLAGAGAKGAAAGAVGVGKLTVLAASVLAIACVLAWIVHSMPARPIVQIAPATTPAEAANEDSPPSTALSAKTATQALEKTYGLTTGEFLRRILPPFPQEREALIHDDYSYIKDVSRVHSLQFAYIDGVLTQAGFSYPPMDFQAIVEYVLRIDWYHVENLAAIEWTPTTADWVSSGGLQPDVDIEKHLNALAMIVSGDIGKTVTFERSKQSRWCIVTKGPFHDHDAPQNREGFHPLIVSLMTPDAEELAQWQKKPPRGSRTRFQFQEVGRDMDAPCFGEGFGDMFYVMADARLKRDDPDYKADLQQVIENVRAQVGGTWTLEQREIDVWTAVVK